MVFFKRLMWCLLLIVPVWANGVDDTAGVTKINRAELVSERGNEGVNLPHILTNSHYGTESGLVRYTLRFTLPAVGEDPPAIYIPKISLSGQLFLNGDYLGGCAIGLRDAGRCLSRPWLLTPPASTWRAGDNVLELSIFANDQQMNGLSAVYVGPAETLFWNHYLPRRLLLVELVAGLGWLSFTLAFLSFATFCILPAQRLYLWFSIACLASALSNMNIVSSLPAWGVDYFSWLIFSSRYVSMVFIWLTLACALRIAQSWLPPLMVGIAITASALIGLSDKSRLITVLTYVPFGIIIIGITFAIVKQAITRREFAVIATAIVSILILGTNILDWFRLLGRADFDGIYLTVYTIATAMLLVGGLQISTLAVALRKSQRMAVRLDTEVAARTRELEQLNEQLTILSRTDSLTGLPNRRWFDETLSREFSRTQRNGSAMTVMVMDVDFFKYYNDTYGHPQGDVCLIKIGTTLAQQSRRELDFMARIGGEEFAFIDLSGNQDGVRQIAHKMREAIAQLQLPHARSPFGVVTISIGVAVFQPAIDHSARDLLSRADQALYRAKANGRNCIEFAHHQDML